MKNGVDWKERTLIRKLYQNQKVIVRLGNEITEEIEIVKGVSQGCRVSPTIVNTYL